MSALLERAIAAHGGRERWERLGALDVTFNVAGPAFAMQGRGGRRRRIHARVRAHEPHVTFRNFGAPGRTATFDHGAVAIGDARRAADEARASAQHHRRWDDLDELGRGHRGRGHGAEDRALTRENHLSGGAPALGIDPPHRSHSSER